MQKLTAFTQARAEAEAALQQAQHGKAVLDAEMSDLRQDAARLKSACQALQQVVTLLHVYTWPH